jgi:hypothetical protein
MEYKASSDKIIKEEAGGGGMLPFYPNQSTNFVTDSSSNISNPTMRTGLYFKSAQFDQVRGEAEDWIKMRGLEI